MLCHYGEIVCVSWEQEEIRGKEGVSLSWPTYRELGGKERKKKNRNLPSERKMERERGEWGALLLLPLSFRQKKGKRGGFNHGWHLHHFCGREAKEYNTKGEKEELLTPPKDEKKKKGKYASAISSPV